MHLSKFSTNCWLCLVGFTLCIANPTPSMAIDEFGELKMISRLPMSDREVERAFGSSRGSACELIPPGESMEVRSFVNFLTERDRTDARNSRPLASSRRDLFSVGLEFERADRDALPALSRGTIAGYLEDHFVSIQARVRRDLLDRKLYFHDRPLALTAQFRGSKLTQSFEPLVSASIREFHSLGLFVPEEKRIKKPEDFRTIVLVFRADILRPIGKETDEVFEFAFIQGREFTDSVGEKQLECHVFVTSESRTLLNHVRRASRPTSADQCSILGRIAVTEYDSTGLYPKTSATRNYRIAKQASFPMTTIEEYCAAQKWQGGIETNLPQVLGAIIDQKLNLPAE